MKIENYRECPQGDKHKMKWGKKYSINIMNLAKGDRKNLRMKSLRRLLPMSEVQLFVMPRADYLDSFHPRSNLQP